jgi:catechol 2,3-dioxygenase-like lactoylglutathione lyase family enzyme
MTRGRPLRIVEDEKLLRVDRMTRRAGVVGAHSLDHFSLVVPDLDEAAAFYQRFGLEMKPAGDTLELFTAGNPHRWGRYQAGPSKVLDYLSFGIYEDDVPAFRKRLAERNVAIVAAPPNALDDSGLWFHDDDGNLIELRVAEKCSPDAKATTSNPSTPEGVVAMPLRVDAPFVRPRRLSHILVFSTDVPRSIEFYSAIVGLALSDAAADVIGFMHGVHGSDHHLIAFAKSDYRGFHHCSWDVGSVNDVGLGAMQMADAGHVRGWGFGRHVLGSNYFHYIRDPWGSYCEYSHDIDYVPAGGNWEARHVTPDNGFYLWGPVPPEDFAFNYESPAASLSKDLLSSAP